MKHIDVVLLPLVLLGAALGFVYSFFLGMTTCHTSRCTTILGRTILSAAAAEVAVLLGCLFVWLWWPGDPGRRAKWLAWLLAVVVVVPVAATMTAEAVGNVP